MDTLLENGQHALDNAGLPINITETQELIQQLMIRLSVAKDSFKYDRLLGSRLNLIRGGSSESLNRQALTYLKEAAAPMPEVDIISAQCRFSQQDKLEVMLEAKIKGKTHQLEVKSFGYL